MKCSNDKCPTYLKEEKNLLENIDNQDKILEEKLSEKKKAKEKLKKKESHSTGIMMWQKIQEMSMKSETLKYQLWKRTMMKPLKKTNVF